jgi:hypothetical protein
MPHLKLPRGSNPGRYDEISSPRLINAYSEVTVVDDEAQIALFFAAGLTARRTVTDVPCRGGLYVPQEDAIYAVFQDGLWKITFDGTTWASSFIDYIPGSGEVSMASNQASPNVQIAIVPSTGNIYICENDAVTVLDTTDIGSFNSVTFLDGYFVFTRENGEIYNSGINATTINGTDLAEAEGDSDILLGAIVLRQELWMLGAKSIEIWRNEANEEGSPFGRLDGAVVPRGVAALATAKRFDNSLGFVGDDGIVYRMEGYQPKRISNHAVERSIAAETDKSVLTAFAFSERGHSFYAVSGTNFTWVFDAASGEWHERVSYGRTRWRASVFVNAFGKNLVGTNDSGILYEIDPDARTEGSSPIVVKVRLDQMESFPTSVAVAAIDFMMVTGRALITGTTPQTAPIFTLRWSDDMARWKGNREISLGAIGQREKRVRATRLGSTAPKVGRCWELELSDPHIFALKYIYVTIEQEEDPDDDD